MSTWLVDVCICCRLRPSRYSQILARKRRALEFVDLLLRSRKQPPRVFKLRQRERVSRYKPKRPRPRRNKDREHQHLSSIHTHARPSCTCEPLKRTRTEQEGEKSTTQNTSLCQPENSFFLPKSAHNTQHNRRFELSLFLAGFFVRR